MVEWTGECDVVVVGSGGGALTGAYTAAVAGLDTVVLEKTEFFGGTSSYSGASIWLPGTAAQERAGLDDSTENARTYLRELLGEDQAERRDAFVETAPAVVDLLEQSPHMTFEYRPFPDYYRRPGRMDAGRSINPIDLPADEIGDLRDVVRPDPDLQYLGQTIPDDQTLIGGRSLIGRLLLSLRGTGKADLRTRSAVTSLIEEDGRVAGVEYTDADGATQRLKARKGVLLAAGGIEGAQDLRDEYGTPGRAQWSMGPDGANTGDLLRAAQAVGADTDLLDQAWWCPGVELPTGAAAFLVGVRGGLVVDSTGHRYLDEFLPYDQFGRAMIARDGADDGEGGTVTAVPSYLIFDSSSGPILPGISIPNVAAQDHLDAGTWVVADTIEELAGKISVPADALVETVERFGAQAENGVDEDFHRGEDPYGLFFCAPSDTPNKALVPLRTGPFYAARIVLSDLGTKGGVRTDVEGRVLRADGSTIDGLYAAGNTSASLSGRFYPGPGVPLGTAMVFSYRAVQDMTR